MIMKECAKCKTQHDNRGAFCSRSCANSRSFSRDSRLKKSESGKKYWQSLDPESKASVLEQRLSKYDFEEQQRRAQETKLLKSWSRPYSQMSHDAVKKRLLAERGYNCEICGCGHMWNGMSLTLEMDHIDGNSKNNSVENLRILCPNCHSQTPTHRGKNIRYKKIPREQSR